MRPINRYPVLGFLFRHFHWRQQETLSCIVAALIECGAARSISIASVLAEWFKIRTDSALNRFYRLLRNPRIHDIELSKSFLGMLAHRLGRQLIIAVDWTEWHSDNRMLSACVVTDKRAIPVHVAAFHKTSMPTSQNVRENNFIKLLAMILKELGLRTILLCDRGFRRVSWLSLLQKCNLDFVVRLVDDVHVQLYEGAPRRALSAMGLVPGSVKDLGWVGLRQDSAVTVRVVGVWHPGAKEPWWLATSLDDDVKTIVAYYDRRMTIEEQFRDTKGKRFGVKLGWTQFKDPEHLARVALLVGISIFVWMAVGIARSEQHPSSRLIDRIKGPRFSYVTIGIHNMGWARQHMRLNFKNLTALLLPPNLRLFEWIDYAQYQPLGASNANFK